MTQLNCSVDTCQHNADNYCCKGRIIVEGSSAKNTAGTCCGSFDERSSDSFTNRYETPDMSLEVECEAKHCVYNEDMYCKADRIGIAGNGANESGETACASFHLRG